MDGIWLKRSWGGTVENVSVLVAVGVKVKSGLVCKIAFRGTTGDGRLGGHHPLSFLKHVNGGLIFVNSPILKFVNGAQKPHLRCADSLPTIRFPAVYLPFLKNQWKITWISRSVCE